MKLCFQKKKLAYEVKEYKSRDEENKMKIRALEQKAIKLSQKKDDYKFKLSHTQELLAKEKIDNENNLLALKKVLSSKINNTLENRVNHYKDKNIREKDQFINAIYMLKKDKDDINKSKYKEKKHIADNLIMESRYDSNYFKKSKRS